MKARHRTNWLGARSNVDILDVGTGTPTTSKPDKPTKRRILINQPSSSVTGSDDEAVETASKGASNKVVTSKYTLLSFLPKNLFEQFRSVANFYFMSLVVLQAFPPFAEVSTALTAAPILIIICATALKDGIEDWRRHLSDENVNHAKTFTLANTRNWNFPSLHDAGILLRRTRMLLQQPSEFFNFSKSNMVASTSTVQMKLSSEKAPSLPGVRESITSNTPNKQNEEDGPYWQENSWEDVRVGDFVFLRNNESIPADVFIVSSSELDGVCYVETKNLDGETNLKIRRGFPEFSTIKTPSECEYIQGFLDSELPSANLFTYNGNIQITLSDTKLGLQHTSVTSKHQGNKSTKKTKTFSIGMLNMLLRGCVLRDTKWAIGIVVYTGSETKIMLNSGITPSKRSKIDRQLNPLVVLNFWLLGAMCLICALLSAVYTGTLAHENPIFSPNVGQYTPLYAAFAAFFLCLIIFQNIVPISLYLSISVSNTVQSLFINMDVDMLDTETDKFASPRSWNLSDDLGQIEYIFSDKTGTLTCNMMEFRKCSINGVVYGDSFSMPETSKKQAMSAGNIQEARKVIEVEMKAQLAKLFDTKYLSEHLAFVDNVLPTHLDANGEQARKIREFFSLLALCHTVLVEKPEGDERPNHIEYRAQSPDEAALVAAARDVGFAFLKRTNDIAIIDVMGVTRSYKVMNVLEFNSDRKRMSVIIRRPEGQLVLLVKGADSIIFERLAKTLDESEKELQDTTAKQLEAFANQGLRTLCLAYRVIPNYEYEVWAEKYRRAQNSIQNRDKSVDDVAELIERDLTLMGATAIEDRLQDGVPETIATLAKAGIKIWVLTGDKMETAINIGFSCNLLKKSMVLIVINSTTLKDTFNQLLDALEKFWTPEGVPLRKENIALIIDGTSLKYALMSCCRPQLLEIGCRCHSVICCRVSPLQKARVVSLVRKGLGAMCLAIGDGANDVSMIQEADIGIGISGKEGLQAVMASDYAIGQFRFLAKLLLVHGRWGYVRTAEIIFNYFYKNGVWLFVLLWYQFDCGFSADLITDFTYGMFFNTLFTLFPTMFIGFFEQDLNDAISFRIPQIYQKGMKQTVFNVERYWIYMVDAIWQSVIAYFFVRVLYDDSAPFSQGYGGDHDSMGAIISHVCIICVNWHAGLNTTNWTFLTFFGLAASAAIWLGYVLSFTASTDNSEYGQLDTLYHEPHLYLTIMIGVVVALMPRFTFKFAQQYFAPTDSDILLEYQKYSWEADKSVLNMDLISQSALPSSASIVDDFRLRELAVEPERRSVLKTAESDNALEFSRKSGHRVASKVISIQRSQSEKSVAALSERAVLDKEGVVTVKDEYARLLAKHNLKPVNKKGHHVRNSISGLDDFKIKSPDGFAPLPMRRQKSEIIRHSKEWKTIDAMDADSAPLDALVIASPKVSPPIQKQGRLRLAPTKTCIFFMGTQEEIPNTGFCFSHEEGMTDVITPSQSRSTVFPGSPVTPSRPIPDASVVQLLRERPAVTNARQDTQSSCLRSQSMRFGEETNK
ncbi:hypothetical protein BC830DRAFT_1227198 [Chytriomyces sp. MP71]|nr:hypothetical protein BC830DRAFT_1227198 [Chytriomyces sp. MP71]